jgi:glucose-6-phosphate isomerase
MRLPDEAVSYDYQSLLAPQEEWSPAAELRSRHFLPLARLKEIQGRLMPVRGQIAAEREMQQVPPELQPLDVGFIDLPQKTLDGHRRKGEASDLGLVLKHARRLREQTDRVVLLCIGGSYLGAHALFEALCSSYHNELPPEKRLGTPRISFEGNNVDNDAFQDLLDLLENTCVDPEIREERWGVVVIRPTLSEHTMRQLLQMLMLATVVEGRLMGVNPYGQQGVEAYKKVLRTALKG